jgi:hypothetical protein
VVFVPVAEPDRLHPGAFPEPGEALSIGTGIDENATALVFNVKGMAVRVFSFSLAGDKPDRTESTLFHRCLLMSQLNRMP